MDNKKGILENKLACEHGRAESYKKQMVELCIREQNLEAENTGLRKVVHDKEEISIYLAKCLGTQSPIGEAGKV